MSHVLILGGDGYLGWPTAMYFSERGYDVTVVDNYFRRNACTALDTGMLYTVPTLIERAQIWHEKTGREIKVVIGDLAQPDMIRRLFDGRVTYAWGVDRAFSVIPKTVVRYVEQLSAPYSLMNYEASDFIVVKELSSPITCTGQFATFPTTLASSITAHGRIRLLQYQYRERLAGSA